MKAVAFFALLVCAILAVVTSVQGVPAPDLEAAASYHGYGHQQHQGHGHGYGHGYGQGYGHGYGHQHHGNHHHYG